MAIVISQSDAMCWNGSFCVTNSPKIFSLQGYRMHKRRKSSYLRSWNQITFAVFPLNIAFKITQKWCCRTRGTFSLHFHLVKPWWLHYHHATRSARAWSEILLKFTCISDCRVTLARTKDRAWTGRDEPVGFPLTGREDTKFLCVVLVKCTVTHLIDLCQIWDVEYKIKLRSESDSFLCDMRLELLLFLLWPHSITL